jgi:hypothetical protein
MPSYGVFFDQCPFHGRVIKDQSVRLYLLGTNSADDRHDGRDRVFGPGQKIDVLRGSGSRGAPDREHEGTFENHLQDSVNLDLKVSSSLGTPKK